jgi:hypothetical protein
VATSRYRNTNTIEGKYLETPNFPTKAQLDEIPSIQVVVSQYTRLDHLAYKHLGDGKYWWIIAAMNGIEWPLAGFNPEEPTVLRIPTDLDAVLKLF